ncbi:AraC family transcriptional regulator [Rhodococcus sp. NPDC003318]|uniref:helix-turn-helix transcriptional regulator n=1 Tax=Rhodococcus sp. NPDC003318 TaxID=3364503 RepID=UPI0036AD4C5F
MATLTVDPYSDRFETRDPEHAHAFLRERYSDNAMRIRGSREGFRMRHRHLECGPLSLASLVHTMSVEHHVEPLGRWLLARNRGDRLERRTDGGWVRSKRGDLFLVAAPDRPYVSGWDTGDIQLIGIDQHVLNCVAGVAEGGADVRFTGLDVPGPAGRMLARVVDFLLEDIASDRSAHAHPLVVGNAARMFAAALLASFPNTSTSDTDVVRDTTGSEVLRRSVDFVEANADLDIGVTDIARAASSSVRAVQLAFRRELDTTPTRHLRQVRLERARRQLRDAEPGDGTTVTSVAMRWGFSRTSRFSEQYRAAFGEAPSSTLLS